MSQVNNDVKEAVDTLDYILNFVAALWQALPIEMRTYVVIMFTISIVLQTVKKSFLADMSRKKKVNRLWVVSIPVSAGASLLGWYLFKNYVSLWVWWVSGVTAGTVSMGVHRVTMDVVWPFLKGLKDIRLTTKPKNDDANNG